MEIVSLITKIRLKNVKDRGRPIYVYLLSLQEQLVKYTHFSKSCDSKRKQSKVYIVFFIAEHV